MALELNFWEADGPNGETLHHGYRLAKLEAAAPIVQNFITAMSQGTIVLVTLDRTDKQSPWSRLLWVKPGYENSGSLSPIPEA